MSVQLVIVALLAATAAAAATTEKAVKYTECTDKACKAGTCTPKSYTVDKCTEEGTDPKMYWRADDCDANTETFVVKGYKDEEKCKGGTPEKEDVPKECKPVRYTKLTCDSTDGKKITLSVCKKEGCNDGCHKLVFKEDSLCHEGWELPKGTFDSTMCGSLPESVTFKLHKTDNCGDKTPNDPKDIKVNVACTPYIYAVASCKENEGATVKDCPKAGCTEDCRTQDYPLKQYTYNSFGNVYYYIDACPAEGEKTISFLQYDGIKTANKMCADVQQTSKVAECVLPDSNNEGSDGGNSAAATTKGSSNSSGGGNGTTSGNEDDGNTTAGAAQLVAPIGAFALFVLAYAL